MSNLINGIRNKIYLIRGQYVMLDKDVAAFYNIPTKKLNENMKKNKNLFEGMVFQITKEELLMIRSFGDTFKKDRKITYLPTVYNERAAYKMAVILKSDHAKQVSDLILDAFFEMRDLLKNNPELQELKREVKSIGNRMSQLEIDMKGVSPTQVNIGSIEQLMIGHNSVVKNDIDLLVKVVSQLNQQIPKEDKMAGKMDELIVVLKEGKKENISSYIKKVNDTMDLITKASPTFMILKTAIELVHNYFK